VTMTVSRTTFASKPRYSGIHTVFAVNVSYAVKVCPLRLYINLGYDLYPDDRQLKSTEQVLVGFVHIILCLELKPRIATRSPA